LFAQILHRAFTKGVIVLAKEITWGDDGVANLGKPLSVNFDQVDGADIDEEHLQAVLKYNSELVRGRAPQASSKPSKIATKGKTTKSRKTPVSSVEVSVDVSVEVSVDNRLTSRKKKVGSENEKEEKTTKKRKRV